MNSEHGRIPESDERETPQALFDEKHARYRFTLDAAASGQNAKLDRLNTKVFPDLFPWRNERVWCNPPYSDIPTWLEHAWFARAELAYLLLPNWTDRKWWREYVEPYRDGKSDEGPMTLTTEFLGRHRFLYQGLPIRTKKGTVGSPEFGLVGLIFTRKET